METPRVNNREGGGIGAVFVAGGESFETAPMGEGDGTFVVVVIVDAFVFGAVVVVVGV